MKTQATITVGADSLAPEAVLTAFAEYVGILRSVDRELHGATGSPKWRVALIKMASPATFFFEGVAKSSTDKQRIDRTIRLTNDGFKKLELGEKIMPRGFTYATAEACGTIARLRTKHLTVLRVGHLNVGDRIPHVDCEVTERTSATARELVAPKFVELGSLEGEIQAASYVSGKDRFKIVERIFGDVIECVASHANVIKAGGLLERMVVVEGQVQFRKDGHPFKIIAHDIKEMPKGPGTPSLLKLFGSDPEFPISAEDFNDYLRGDCEE